MVSSIGAPTWLLESKNEPAGESDMTLGSLFDHKLKGYGTVTHHGSTATTQYDQSANPNMTAMIQPTYAMPRQLIYNIANSCSIMRLPIKVSVTETLLGGLEIYPKYAYKCENKKCGFKFLERPGEEMDKCTWCGGTELSQPDPKNRLIADEYMTREWNHNGQKIMDISEQLIRDGLIIDDAYLWLRTSYKTRGKKIVKGQVRQIQTIHPPQLFKVADHHSELGKVPGNKYAYVCVKQNHRDKLIVLPAKNDDDEPPDDPRCPQPGCGCEVLPAACYVYFQYASLGSITDTSSPYILAQDEVILSSGKSVKSRDYGIPILIAATDMVKSVTGVEIFFKEFFDRNRPPQSLTIIGTRNPDNLQKQLNTVKENYRKDPHDIPILISQVGAGTRKLVEHINLTGSLNDLQLSDIVEQFRRTTGALYGVMPIYQGQTTDWSGDSLEMSVSTRQMKENREFLDYFYDELLTRRGVTDWGIRVKRSETSDDIRETQHEIEEAVLAEHMDGLGYGHRRDGEGKFVFDKEPTKPTETAMNMPPAGTSGRPVEPSHQPNDMTNDPEGMQGKKRAGETGGRVEGEPASGDKTTSNRR